MAESKCFKIPETFNINEVVAKISQVYQSRGYTVNVYPIGAGVTIEFSKNDQALYNLVGLIEGVKVTMLVVDGILTVNFSNEKWADKIIAFILGWFCCWITWITGGIGAYNQYNLSKNIGNDIYLFSNNVN